MGDFKGASALRVGNARAWNPVVIAKAMQPGSCVFFGCAGSCTGLRDCTEMTYAGDTE